MNWKGYAKLEVEGSLLKPGFCIYLMEIRHEKDKLFYLGMTGDPIYPSARAAFHRLSGHLELTHHSTQNQLKVAFDEKGIDLENCRVIMHHFPIPGFIKWELTKTMRWDELNRHRDTPEYRHYKANQEQVLSLEKALIYWLKKELVERLLNKTKGKRSESILAKNADMKKFIEQIIKDQN